MTTIAFDGEIVAYDSRITRGSVVFSDRRNKMFKKNGIKFVGTGDPADIQKAVNCYLTDSMAPYEFETVVLAYFPNGDFLQINVEKNSIRTYNLKDEIPFATGSGAEFAIAAMDFGYNAKEAVKYAMTRDTHTGGKINWFRVKDG